MNTHTAKHRNARTSRYAQEGRIARLVRSYVKRANAYYPAHCATKAQDMSYLDFAGDWRVVVQNGQNATSHAMLDTLAFPGELDIMGNRYECH